MNKLLNFKNEKGFAPVLVILLVGIVFGVVGLAGRNLYFQEFYNPDNSEQTLQQNQQNINNNNKNGVNTPGSLKSSQNPRPETKYKTATIKRNGENVVSYELKYRDIGDYLVRHGDYFIYLPYEKDSIQVYAQNINTGEVTEILNMSDIVDLQNKNEELQKQSKLDFNSRLDMYSRYIYKVDNYLVMSMSAYLSQGYVFVMDLDELPKPEIKGYSDFNNVQIYTENDLTWVASSFGDACAYSTVLQRINLETLETYGDELQYGNMSVDDKKMGVKVNGEKEEFIFMDFEYDPNGDYGMCGIRIFENMKSDNLLGEKRTLISEQNFPDNVYSYQYDKESDAVYMMNNTGLFVYHFPTGNLRKVGDFDEKTKVDENTNIREILPEGGICLNNGNIIDHTTAKTLAVYSKKCEYKGPKESDELAEVAFEELDLPNNYTLEITD